MADKAKAEKEHFTFTFNILKTLLFPLKVLMVKMFPMFIFIEHFSYQEEID